MFELYPGYDSHPMTALAMAQPQESQHNAAFVPDWNDDGILDLWHPNHYKFTNSDTRWSDPSTNKTIERFDKCFSDWDAVIQTNTNGTYRAVNDGHGFIKIVDGNRQKGCYDVHSTVFLDIDGDGVKDLFVVTGGGRGVGNSDVLDNALFWGKAARSRLGYRMVGGQDAALAARVEGRQKNGNERGRHQYWFDVDGDGDLDFVTLNTERKDEIVTPGKLYLNQGARRFKKLQKSHTDFAEFGTMAVLTDIDMDGVARELVVPSKCFLRAEHDHYYNALCEKKPKDSLTVYRRHPTRFLKRSSVTASPEKAVIAVSIATGDFDLDGIPDIAVLWRNRVVTFYNSSARKRRCSQSSDYRQCSLALGKPTSRLELEICKGRQAAGFRFADFNLNGQLDMLVVCDSVGEHSIFELDSRSLRWKKWSRNLGALNQLSAVLGGDKGFCSNAPISNPPRENCLSVFEKDICRKLKYEQQFLICSTRAARPKEEWVKTKGITVADLNNDGYSDAIVSYKNGRTVLYRNTLGRQLKHKFFSVRLDRSAGAPAAIGAVVQVKTTGMGKGGNQSLIQTRILASLFHETDDMGGHEDRLIFGLAKKGRVVSVTISWPNCCTKQVIKAEEGKFWRFTNSMMKPFEVAPPKNCDDRCFQT